MTPAEHAIFAALAPFASPDDLAAVRAKPPDPPDGICAACGDPYSGDDAESSVNGLICAPCYEQREYICDRCGDSWDNEDYLSPDDYGSMICSDCEHDNRCGNCGGSGGGPDEALKCPVCGGNGKAGTWA